MTPGARLEQAPPVRGAAGDGGGLFAEIVALSPAAIAVLDGPEHRYAVVNDAYRTLARGKGELLGRTFGEVWPEAGTDIVRVLDRVFASGEPFRDADQPAHVERDAGPETIWLTFSFLPMRGPEGRVARILVMVNEVTAHVRALAAARDLAQALEEARGRAAELEAVLDAVPTAVFITRDAEARRIDANRAGQELLGLPPGANASLRLDPGIHPPFTAVRDGVEIPLDELPMQAAARLGLEIRELEYDVVRADGTVRRLVANARPIVDGRGVRRGAVGAFADVTARRAAERELRESEARLRESDRRKTEFLGVLSHELRNPLAPIRNSLVLLAAAEPGSDRARQAREVLERQTAHLTRLVDDLLDATRIASGRIELRRAPFDLRELARRACEDHRSLFERAAVGLRLDGPPGPVPVDGDPTRVAQVLGNLLQNAARFTPAEGRVVVEVGAGPEGARLTVRDSGQGIAPELLPRIFEPLAQATQGLARTRGGLGLGLALVRGLVELHGGSVQARSEGPGHGSEFVVTLPLDASAPAPERARAAAPAVAPRLILVVEDNPDSAQSLAEVLALRGHRVRVAGTGRAGIALARALRPDLVLCDIGLPDLDGYEVARALRAEAGLGRTRLVALSGYARPEDRAHARAAGFDAHVAKPVALEDLAAEVAAAGVSPRSAVNAG